MNKKAKHLPKRITTEKENSSFVQRDESLCRMSFQMEQNIFLTVQAGDQEGLKRILSELQEKSFYLGNMSENDLRQMQYMAVVVVTVVTRIAIQSGVLESDAYNFNDEFIQRIDHMENPEDVVNETYTMILEITRIIRYAHTNYHPAVYRAMEYINKNLHEKLSISMIAKSCGISSTYLSRLFHRVSGETIRSYIQHQKLIEAAHLLQSHRLSCAEIAYMLGFSSQSHFSARFKDTYGITPTEYTSQKSAPGKIGGLSIFP